MRTLAPAVLALSFFLVACDKDDTTPDATPEVTAPDVVTTPDVPVVDAAPDPGPPDTTPDVPPDVVPETTAEVDTGPPPECTVETAEVDCDDDDDCTEDTCDAGVCVHAAIPDCCTEDSQCDDGIACTVDSCNTFQDRCLNLPDSNLCCVATDDCNDNNDCTVDLCAANACVFLQDTSNAACACNSNFDCDDSTDCTTDVCNDGVCSNTPDASASGCCAVDGDCDDQDDATLDVCQQGICLNTSTACADDGDCTSLDACQAGTCTDGACVFAPVAWSGCCQLASECDDGQAATTDTCLSNQCVNSISGSAATCASDAECTSPNACAASTCATQAGLCTEAAVSGGSGCCQTPTDCAPAADHCLGATCEAFACGTEALTGSQPFWTETFETVDGWTVVDDGNGATWQLGTAQAISLPSALYYGQLPAMNYDVGTTTGSATSSIITPPAGATSLTLTFWVAGDIEPISSRDLLWVDVVVGGVATEVWNKDTAGGLGTGWTEQTVDITAQATGPFEVRFSFDSVDAQANAGDGVYIDDVAVLAPCP